jgi:hypothetical protein
MIIVFISSPFALQTLSFARAVQRRHSDSAVIGITIITPLETAPKLPDKTEHNGSKPS